MMIDYVKLTSDASDQYLTALAEIQQNFLKSAAAFAALVPAAPAMPGVPQAADLPTPLEIAESNFTFTEKLLKQQKAFTEKLFAIGTPATGTSAKYTSSKR